MAAVFLSLVFCVQGQHVLPYGSGVPGGLQPFGFNQGVAPAGNIVRAAPLPRNQGSPNLLPNLNIPAPALEIGRSFKRPEGEYGLGSIFESGRTSFPGGASVANGHGRLAGQLGLGNAFVERGVAPGSYRSPGRIIRLQKREADPTAFHAPEDTHASRTSPTSQDKNENLQVAESNPGEIRSYRIREGEYDGGAKYRLAKESLKLNPRKGISFKKPDGQYGIGTVSGGASPTSYPVVPGFAPRLKKFHSATGLEGFPRDDTLAGITTPNVATLGHATLSRTGRSFKKPEGEYGIGSILGESTPVGPYFHHLRKRQAIGSGKVTAVVVEYDKDSEAPSPRVMPPPNNYAPVVGLTVEDPPGGAPDRFVLKNVIYKKRPGALKPTGLVEPSPRKTVLRIPDSIILPSSTQSHPPTAGVHVRHSTTPLPVTQVTGRKHEVSPSTTHAPSATIEFRPTFSADNFHQTPPHPPQRQAPAPRPFKSTSFFATFPKSLPGFPTKPTNPPKPADHSHKLSAPPLVGVPPGQVVYNRQLASSVPVQPVRSSPPFQSRPPLPPLPTPVPTQPPVQVQQVYPQQQFQSAPQAYPGTVQAPEGLYQQYTPLAPGTYPVPQQPPVAQFDQASFGLSYPDVLPGSYVQARSARSAEDIIRDAAFDTSSVYALSKRIVQNVHS